MQLIKFEIIMIVRDIEDVDLVSKSIDEKLSELSTIYNYSSAIITGKKYIDYHDPESQDEINNWTEKSTLIIDEEIEIIIS